MIISPSIFYFKNMIGRNIYVFMNKGDVIP